MYQVPADVQGDSDEYDSDVSLSSDMSLSSDVSAGGSAGELSHSSAEGYSTGGMAILAVQ